MLLGKVHPEPEYEARKWRNYDTWKIDTPPWVVESFTGKTFMGIIFLIFLAFMIYMVYQMRNEEILKDEIRLLGKTVKSGLSKAKKGFSTATSRLSSGSLSI